MKIILLLALLLPMCSFALELEMSHPQLELLANHRGPGMDLSISTTVTSPTANSQRVAICVRYFNINGTQIDQSLGRFEALAAQQQRQLTLQDPRKNAAFFEDLDHVHISVVNDRTACSSTDSTPLASGYTLPVNLDMYITALGAVDILEPFGTLVLGETPDQVIARICNKGLFVNMQDRDDVCAQPSEQPTFKPFADGQLDPMTRQAMQFHLEFLTNYHHRVRLHNKGIQLIASDPTPLMIAPIQLFGVPYELHLGFEGLDQYIARWHLEQADQTVQPFCFTSEGHSFCEYPTVLTRVTLKSNDPRRAEVCSEINATLDQRYGTERPVIRAGTRLNADASDCSTIEYLANRYLQELHMPSLRTLQRAQVTPTSTDDASGL